ncbi:MAG: DUF4239 domain-containing protein [Planctomycetia bacterium]|nr:DUF4239 domain-containing protein [Planctomycetia bacterium]
MISYGFQQGIGIVIGGMVAALSLVWLARSVFPADVLRRGHDATGNMLSVVGTLYAVLLGLVVVDAMVRFERAMDVVQAESNCLADVFLLSERLPDPQRRRLRELCRTYAYQVVELEWPLMQQARVSVEARRTALELARGLDDFEPQTEAQKAVYPLLLEQLRALWDHRRERSSTAQYGIPTVEWIALIIGGAVTIVFAGLFSVENGRLQALLTCLSALVVGLNLYLVSLFGYPFAGELAVSSRPFKVDIGIFEGLYGASPAHPGETAADGPGRGPGLTAEPPRPK